jgi:hypothetical protein
MVYGDDLLPRRWSRWRAGHSDPDTPSTEGGWRMVYRDDLLSRGRPEPQAGHPDPPSTINRR